MLFYHPLKAYDRSLQALGLSYGRIVKSLNLLAEKSLAAFTVNRSWTTACLDD